MTKINRTEIFRAANYLVSTGLTRSDAFKAAWQMAKQGGVSRVAGVTYEGRQRLLARLAAYQPEQISLRLDRDMANIFDSSAVAVIATVEGKGSATIGFLPSPTAQKLARLMDRHPYQGHAGRACRGF